MRAKHLILRKFGGSLFEGQGSAHHAKVAEVVRATTTTPALPTDISYLHIALIILRHTQTRQLT
jgi:hypothetical protein